MTISIDIRARHLLGAAVIIAVGVVLAAWWMTPAHSQPAGPQPVGSYAFLARADNPVDALAASSVAGQLGAPVYLTGSTTLDEQARQGLVDTNPQVVVLAGGSAALSPAVEEQVRALLPDAQVQRFAGKGRTETARLVNELTGQLGVDRPVLAGATVAGDVGIDGTLTLDGNDVGAALAALTADLAAATARIAALETTLTGVSRDGETLLLSGMNIQVVNGAGTTDTSNGLGNLILGYNTPRAATTAADRAGSHYLVIGDEHHWTAFGGIIAGAHHTASGDGASVTGGFNNAVSGTQASVSGGTNNTASASYASVSGGVNGKASGGASSVTGGQGNTASGFSASVASGGLNTASGTGAAIAGGWANTASGSISSVSGGQANAASASYASVAGGLSGAVSNNHDSLIGNTPFADG